MHGDRDELSPAETSFFVQALAGTGEAAVLEGAGHLLIEAGDEGANASRPGSPGA